MMPMQYPPTPGRTTRSTAKRMNQSIETPNPHLHPFDPMQSAWKNPMSYEHLTPSYPYQPWGGHNFDPTDPLGLRMTDPKISDALQIPQQSQQLMLQTPIQNIPIQNLPNMSQLANFQLPLQIPNTPRGSKRFFDNSESDCESPEKKKIALYPMSEGYVPAKMWFNLKELYTDCEDEPTEPYSCHSQVDTENESLNTPRHSPVNSPRVSPQCSPFPLRSSNHHSYQNSPLMSPMTPVPYTSSLSPICPASAPTSPRKKKRKSHKSIINRDAELLNLQIGMKVHVEHSMKEIRDGVILRLRIWNFMNHDSRKFDFHNRLTFIVGPNGSGKSAIFLSVMLGLGASAAATRRRKTFPEFIMDNKPSAKIELILSNYNGTISRRKYGKVICFSRLIQKSSTQYLIRRKIKNNEYFWDKLKKNELELILQSLQIDPSNPLQIMTQEDSTSFLRDNDHHSHFKRFDSATNRKQYREVLFLAEEHIKYTKEHVEKKAEIKAIHEQNVRVLQEEYEECNKIERYKQECIQLTNEYNWALVKEDENRLSELQTNIDNVETQVQRVKEEKKRSETELANIESGLDTEGSAIKTMESEYNDFSKTQDKARRKLQGVTVTNTKIDREIKSVEQFIRDYTRQVEEIQLNLNDTTSSKERSNERKKQQDEKTIREYNLKIDEGTKELQKLTSEKEKLESEFKNAEMTEHEKKDQLKLLQSALNKRETEKRKIKLDQDTKYERFGPCMKKLVERIPKMKWHGKTPLGPLGAYFTCKSPEFFVLADYILNSAITSFAVSSPHDIKQLNTLILEAYGKDTRTPLVHHVPDRKEQMDMDPTTAPDGSLKGKAVVGSHRILMDILEITDPFVFRVLVDMYDIERIVLMRTDKEAYPAFKHYDKHHMPHRTVGFTLEWHKFIPVPYAVKPIFKPKRSPLLQMTKADNTAQVLSDIERLKGEAEQLIEQVQAAKSNTVSYKNYLRQCEKNIRKKTDEITGWRSERWTLQNYISKSPEADPVSNNEFIEDRLKWVQENKATHEKLLQEKQSNDVVVKEESKKIKEMDAKIGELMAKINASKNDKDGTEKQCTALRKIINRCEAKIDKLKSERNSLQKQCNPLSKSLAKRMEDASEKGERVDTTRLPKDILADKISKTEHYKQNVKKLNKRGVIKRDLENSMKLVNEMQTGIASARNLLMFLEPLVRTQWDFLLKQQDENFRTVQMNYQALIEKRGYKGEVSINFDKELLAYFVAPDADAAKRARRSVKDSRAIEESDSKAMMEFTSSLSGGEKSFSTFCFLAALRQTMRAPFYMIDEGDVNMDAGNAKTCLDILVDQSRNQPDTQFFDITHNFNYIQKDERYIDIIPLEKKDRVMDYQGG